MRSPACRSTTLPAATAGRCLLVGLLVWASGAVAQPAPFTLRGRIVAESNDRPLRHALITLGSGRARGVLTDDDGRFEMRLSDPVMSVTVAKAGYATTTFTVPVRPSTPDQELVVRMPRGGVISGHVVDSNGETAIGVKMIARIEGAPARQGRSFEAEVDDLGEYRISGLPAGRYAVSPLLDGMRIATGVELERIQTQMQQGRGLQEVLQQPASPPRSADVRGGDETAGIDFDVPTRTTIRALVPMKHLVPTPWAVPAGQQAMFTTPPQAELGGNRIAAEFDRGGPPPTGFPPIYFPGTSRVEAAQLLLVEAGSDISGADMTFAAASVARLAGKAVNAAGGPVNGRVQLGVSQRSGGVAPDPRSVRTAGDGSFEFSDVAPGDYVLQVIGEPGMGTPPEFGSEFVTVAARHPPMTITTSPGATLEGRFVVEGAPDPPMRAFSLHASPTDLDRSPPGGRGPEGLAIHDDGRFYLTGLHGPMRFSAPNTLPGWYLKSVTIGGVDATDVPFDFGHAEATVSDAQIVLSNAGAAIAGTIEDRPGSRAPSAVVIAFSTARTSWFDGSRHIKYVSSGPNGSFDVTGLPPGEYFVAAVDAAAPLDWRGPDALEFLVPRAVRVTAREGAVATVALELVQR